MIEILSWLGAILGITGAILLARKNYIGWLAWLIGNLSMSVYGLYTHQYSIFIMFVVYEVISIHGFLNWTKEGSRLEEKKLRKRMKEIIKEGKERLPHPEFESIQKELKDGVPLLEKSRR